MFLMFEEVVMLAIVWVLKSFSFLLFFTSQEKIIKGDYGEFAKETRFAF